jgi:hypothetical protein
VNNSNIEYKIATYSFQDPLSRDFVGVSALQWYNNAKPATTFAIQLLLMRVFIMQVLIGG